MSCCIIGHRASDLRLSLTCAKARFYKALSTIGFKTFHLSTLNLAIIWFFSQVLILSVTFEAVFYGRLSTIKVQLELSKSLILRLKNILQSLRVSLTRMEALRGSVLQALVYNRL